MAPGGQLGRFCIWTQSAFQALDGLFGSDRKQAVEKHNYQLNRSLLTNADIARVINSNEIQEVVRPAKDNRPVHDVQKKNPLKNKKAMDKLNPHHSIARAIHNKRTEDALKKRAEALK